MAYQEGDARRGEGIAGRQVEILKGPALVRDHVQDGVVHLNATAQVQAPDLRASGNCTKPRHREEGAGTEPVTDGPVNGEPRPHHDQVM